MNNIELLKEYIELLDRNQDELADSEYYTLYSVRNDPNLYDIVRDIDSAYTKEDRYNVLKQYESQLNYMAQTELEKMKDIYQKAFGIKLDKIEFKKLKSGIDVIAFYDSRINRKRIINYSYAKSLVSEFTDAQNKNIDFQTDDYEKNANEIAKDQASKNIKRELDMIDIETFRANYNDLINRVPNQEKDKVFALNKLLNEAESRKIKYINPENLIGLDEYGTIIEASLNRDNEIEIGTAADITHIDSIDNEGNLFYGSEIEETVQKEAEKDNNEVKPTTKDEEEEIEFPDDAVTNYDNFKKIVQEEMEKHQIQGDVDTIYKKVEEYASNLNQLEIDYQNKILNENSYEFYKDLSEGYINYTNELEKDLSKVKTRTLGYTREAGYIIAIITSIISIVIALIAIIMMNK